MPIPRKVLNAFTASEVRSITGISLPMISYLLRSGYLVPSYAHGTRGRVRYYSYRDLVIARIVQRLREGGIELSKLKEGIQKLSSDSVWKQAVDYPSGPRGLQLLVTDGHKVFIRNGGDVLEDVHGQRTFSFVVNLAGVQTEVRNRIKGKRQTSFTMKVNPIEFDTPRKPRKTLRSR